ncbi:hypothetical protein D3C72_549350 [compost metagenome]
MVIDSMSLGLISFEPLPKSVVLEIEVPVDAPAATPKALVEAELLIGTPSTTYNG